MTVYFVRSDCGRVKIGYTSGDGTGRLRGLQTGSPRLLTLAAAAQGADEAIERHLHQRFASSRVHGEWFEPSDNLDALIESVASTGSIPGAELVVDPLATLLDRVEPTILRRADEEGTCWNLRGYWAFPKSGLIAASGRGPERTAHLVAEAMLWNDELLRFGGKPRFERSCWALVLLNAWFIDETRRWEGKDRWRVFHSADAPFGTVDRQDAVLRAECERFGVDRDRYHHRVAYTLPPTKRTERIAPESSRQLRGRAVADIEKLLASYSVLAHLRSSG